MSIIALSSEFMRTRLDTLAHLTTVRQLDNNETASPDSNGELLTPMCRCALLGVVAITVIFAHTMCISLQWKIVCLANSLLIYLFAYFFVLLGSVGV